MFIRSAPQSIFYRLNVLTYTTQMNIFFSSFQHKYSIKKGNHKKKECFKNYIKTNRRCLCSLSLLEFLCKYHISYLRFTREERKKKKMGEQCRRWALGQQFAIHPPQVKKLHTNIMLCALFLPWYSIDICTIYILVCITNMHKIK